MNARTGSLRHEARGLLELPRLAWQLPALARLPRGARQSVLVLPGRGTDDVTTLPLRSYLRFLGYDVHGWALGRNDGDVDRLAPAVGARVGELAARSGAAVALVGQSMGGTIARAAAGQDATAIAQIITLGSPSVRFRTLRAQPAPLTVVFSALDRVVAPHLALAGTEGAEVIEVSSTHYAMGIDPDVWAVVGRRLATTRPAAPAAA